MTGKSDSGGGSTPLMRQFQAIKVQHPDKILFFRMGDFYEMFGEDAVTAAPVLGIALTSRSHGKGERIPLAGVPYHSVDRYLARILAKGFKVVIVEQVEDPKLAKGLVKREVVEILTPGTATVESAETDLDGTSLAAVCGSTDRQVGLAWLDINTGVFLVDEGNPEMILEKLRVLDPTEILFPSDSGDSPFQTWLRAGVNEHTLTPYEDWNFDFKSAERDLNRHFGTTTLEGFGIGRENSAVAAAGAIFRYLKENHREQLSHLRRLTRIDDSEHMLLDYASVRNLELIRSVSLGDEQHTLLSVINRCQTPAGLRRLRRTLVRPFRVREPIERRLGGVEELVNNRDLAFQLNEELKGSPDLERLAGRLGIGKLNPRQLAAIGEGLKVATRVAELLKPAFQPHWKSIASAIPDHAEAISRIEQALVEEPPLVANKGNIFKRGYSAELDELNDSIRGAREYIGSLQQIERERTGISSLKVGFNKVFGYYLEVTKANADQVPEEYLRKQTLVNGERFITPELKEKEELILSAEDKIFRLETKLYDELVDDIGKHIGSIQLTGELLAETDMVGGLAELAVERGYCRPVICEDTRLNIVDGRHPVVESVLPVGSFVTNDIELGPETHDIAILTGPNMSGKSTYLRQVGLIVIMAQIGSYVPAAKAEIGLVDRVFTRVGAMDNLAGGQSTFLVEMVETANILNNATAQSLVLLDEVGRGTSTFDGLSVAWSVVERLNESCCSRTIFATHYHELTGMAELYDKVANYQVAVKKWEDQVVFLHKIIPGGCDDSYGIEVARLAGLPKSTIARAKQILKLLDSGKFTRSELGKGLYQERVQTSFFDAKPSAVEEKLKAADIENMTPVEAFDFLRSLKDDL